jgi:hypothetical protein
MAKRFTDTDKWKKTWFSNLKPKHKLLWLYLLDLCDNAGFFDMNIKNINYALGEKYTVEDINAAINKHLVKISTIKYWIPKFIQFQYGKGLSEECKAHKSIIDALANYNITWCYENLKFRYNTNTPQTASKEISNCYLTVQDKDKDILLKIDPIESLCKALDPILLDFFIDKIKPSKEIQQRWLLDNKPEEINYELDKFKNYLSAKGKVYKNYSAAFSNWLKSDFRSKKGIKLKMENQWR